MELQRSQDFNLSEKNAWGRCVDDTIQQLELADSL